MKVLADSLLSQEHQSEEVYREFLSDINTEIDRGDVICVIGPSGSGKSTFLRCLNMLEKPSGGQIIFEGDDLTDK
ncbi:MAG: amino acid ABC transporter ATP-binding protein, partial [Lachnospiraceae bacterium]|nr:amino acid ABC transporter ATP-binding protein [Lachnospiraceae bacterium]